MARRDRIGRTYFKKVLPLDNFRIENDALAFDNLEAKYGFVVGASELQRSVVPLRQRRRKACSHRRGGDDARDSARGGIWRGR